MTDFYFLQILSKNLVSNYLSYLIILTKNKIETTNPFFIQNHIITFNYKEGVEKDVKNFIEKQFDEINNNNKKFVINNQKYNKLLEEYDKLYKYTLFTSKSYDLKKKNKFEDIINEHKKMLIEKIAQDISFIISLSIQNKDKILNLIENDLEFIINKNNEKIIQTFLDEQKVTKELSNILNNFIQTLEENNNNKIYSDINEDYNDIKYDEEIISIDGIQKIYEDENDNEENEDNNEIDDNSSEDKGEDLNDSNEEEYIYNIKEHNEENNLNNFKEEDIFKISFLIQEIKDKLKYSIILINLKLYYKFFWTVINKIFINDVSRLISEKVLNGDI
jgi:hypothetical protein